MDNDRRDKFVTPDDEPLQVDRSRAQGPNLLAGRAQRLAEKAPLDTPTDMEALAIMVAEQAVLPFDATLDVIQRISKMTYRNPLVVKAILALVHKGVVRD